MLGYRFRGDYAETEVLLAKLRELGVEVLDGGGKRRDKFTDGYGTLRLPDAWLSEAGVAAVPDGPIRAQATIERRALPSGERRPRRRG